ncbi:MAG: GNAT family N-acetyltransferase [Phycisphaerales bacterium]|nr:GNAT family N-acetyltransferase [Phycisphaerales bacterium]
MLGLHEIELSQKPIFDDAFAALKQPVSDYTFAGTWMWGGALALSWSRLHDHVCVFANSTGDLSMLLPPIPLPGAGLEQTRRAVRESFAIMDAYNAQREGESHSRIEYVSDELLARIQSALAGEGGLALTPSPMWSDYVYETGSIIDLAGKALKSKRHARSKFVRECPEHWTEPMSPERVPACIELLEGWARHGDASHMGETSDVHIGTDVLRKRDELATGRALRDFREAGFKGMVLMVRHEGRERLAGFTLGERLSPSQCVVVAEKTDPTFDGSPQFIFSEFCRQFWADSPECNVGDDWGIPSLRFTKQSYRPILMRDKHVLARVPAESLRSITPIDAPLANTPHTITIPEPAVSLVPAMAMSFREASVSDTPALNALEQACFGGSPDAFNKRQIRDLILNPRSRVMLAESEGRAAGWSVGLLRQHRESRSGRIYSVGVHPDARGRGVGRALVERTIGALRDMGAKRVYLEVRAGNEPAIRLYERLGFVRKATLPNYYSGGIDGVRMMLGPQELTLFDPATSRA